MGLNGNYCQLKLLDQNAKILSCLIVARIQIQSWRSGFDWLLVKTISMFRCYHHRMMVFIKIIIRIKLFIAWTMFGLGQRTRQYLFYWRYLSCFFMLAHTHISISFPDVSVKQRWLSRIKLSLFHTKVSFVFSPSFLAKRIPLPTKQTHLIDLSRLAFFVISGPFLLPQQMLQVLVFIDSFGHPHLIVNAVPPLLPII